MTPINDIKKDAYLRLLLQGPPGSGKTTLACGFPGAYIIDIDVNLAGPIRYRQAHGLPLPLGYDRLNLDEQDNPVSKLAQFSRLNSCLGAAVKDPNVQTIVIDSATGLIDLVWAEVERQQPGCKDGRQLWGFFFQAGKQLIAQLTAIRKHIVLIAHEKVEADSMTQIQQFRVAWPGQLGDYLGAFFTNVWRCEVQVEGFPPKPKFVVRTFQDHQHYGLKNDFELPVLSEFQWDTIAKHFVDQSLLPQAAVAPKV